MTNNEKIRAALEKGIELLEPFQESGFLGDQALKLHKEALALLDTPAPAQAEEVEKMAKALRMVVHNAAIQRGKKGKAWDGDFVIKQCQSALTEYLAAQDGRCPDCGYTEEDKRLHGDHHLCPRAALQSPARPVVKPLVWSALGSPEFNEWISGNGLGTYRIEFEYQVFKFYFNGVCIDMKDTIEEAKSAAEAHWQAKIGECLTESAKPDTLHKPASDKQALHKIEKLQCVADAAARACIDLGANLEQANKEYMRGEIPKGAFHYVLSRHDDLHAALQSAGYTEKHKFLGFPVQPERAQLAAQEG